MTNTRFSVTSFTIFNISVMPHLCVLCNKQFQRQSTLKRHQQNIDCSNQGTKDAPYPLVENIVEAEDEEDPQVEDGMSLASVGQDSITRSGVDVDFFEMQDNSSQEDMLVFSDSSANSGGFDGNEWEMSYEEGAGDSNTVITPSVQDEADQDQYDQIDEMFDQLDHDFIEMHDASKDQHSSQNLPNVDDHQSGCLKSELHLLYIFMKFDIPAVAFNEIMEWAKLSSEAGYSFGHTKSRATVLRKLESTGIVPEHLNPRVPVYRSEESRQLRSVAFPFSKTLNICSERNP